MNQHQLQLLKILVEGRMAATRSERGASAVEWVVIAGLVAAICIAVGAILMGNLTGRAERIDLGE